MKPRIDLCILSINMRVLKYNIILRGVRFEKVTENI